MISKFAIKTLIPFTEERTIWKETTAWLEESMAHLREAWPGVPEQPKVTRSPHVLEAAVSTMVEVLEYSAQRTRELEAMSEARRQKAAMN